MAQLYLAHATILHHRGVVTLMVTIVPIQRFAQIQLRAVFLYMIVSMVQLLPAARQILLAAVRDIKLVAAALVPSVVLPILCTRLVVQVVQFVVEQYKHKLRGVAQAELLVAQATGSAAKWCYNI